MSLSGIYAAKFVSSLHNFGTGVAILTDNSIHGGDAQYLYYGKYSRSDRDGASANVIAVAHSGSNQSVVGNFKQFRLELTGKVVENGNAVNISLDGHVKENPSLKISINLIRMEDLVEA